MVLFAMVILYLWSHFSLYVALFGIEFILLLLILLMDQIFIDFLFRHYIEFNKVFMELNDWFDKLFIEPVKQRIKARIKLRKQCRRRRGLPAYINAYNASFASLTNTPGFNLINKIANNVPVQIDSGVFSHAISELSLFYGVNYKPSEISFLLGNFICINSKFTYWNSTRYINTMRNYAKFQTKGWFISRANEIKW